MASHGQLSFVRSVHVCVVGGKGAPVLPLAEHGATADDALQHFLRLQVAG